MKAKRNRYDLRLWDVRKLSLYGRAAESVQTEAAMRAWAPSRDPGPARNRRGRTSCSRTRLV